MGDSFRGPGGSGCRGYVAGIGLTENFSIPYNEGIGSVFEFQRWCGGLPDNVSNVSGHHGFNIGHGCSVCRQSLKGANKVLLDLGKAGDGPKCLDGIKALYIVIVAHLLISLLHRLSAV